MRDKLSDQRKRVGLLLIGGIHHVLHLIPIAKGLEDEGGIDVVVFVTSETERDICREVLTGLEANQTKIKILKANPAAKWISRKLAFLLFNLKIWKALDALIVAERTSTILRYFSKKLPPFIHIPHGAGDRAKSYDPRIRHFDHVLVAGAKDKARMIDLNLVSDQSCHVTGYIKPFAVKLIYPAPQQIFTNTLPVVLYNPHFSPALSSWETFGFKLLEAFSERKDFNFIIAPHIRLFSSGGTAQRKKLEAFAKFDNIHIDAGSERSTDMSYTRAADIYLGDVSSQVYEFLSEPKPCLFLDNGNTQWQDNPDYAHWSYGPVCSSVSDVMGALEQANMHLPKYGPVQIAGCNAAKGDAGWDPITRAAKAVKTILGRR